MATISNKIPIFDNVKMQKRYDHIIEINIYYIYMWCKCLPDIWTSYQNGHMLEVISYTWQNWTQLLFTVNCFRHGPGTCANSAVVGNVSFQKESPPSVNMHPRRHTWPNSLTHECFLLNLGFSHNHINVMTKLQQLRLLMASDNNITWLNGCH